MPAARMKTHQCRKVAWPAKFDLDTARFRGSRLEFRAGNPCLARLFSRLRTSDCSTGLRTDEVMIMKKLVECVPNISEGRDQAVIDAVTAVIEEVDGVHLLDVDPGRGHQPHGDHLHRRPRRRGRGRLPGGQAGRRTHRHEPSTRGAHPRHGATDVCPFVPVRGVTMEECVEIARQVGQRIGEELEIPVYLYEEAATSAERRNLADVRKGEYEALPDKLGTEEWKPDFGPNAWNERTARTGATNVSARGFLVAYNVNLNTRDKKHRLRTSPWTSRKPAGPSATTRASWSRTTTASNILVPGPYRLDACKAVGWVIPEYDRAQVSMNLVNTAVTKPHQAFEACRASARDRGARVTGSELVGLIPEGDMLAAGKHYLRKAGPVGGHPHAR